jgi:hypothetical protein
MDGQSKSIIPLEGKPLVSDMVLQGEHFLSPSVKKGGTLSSSTKIGRFSKYEKLFERVFDARFS